MKGFILFIGVLAGAAVTARGGTAHAETRPSLYAENDFAVVIAQGYGEQAETYQRIHAEVESASREGEVLEDLSKTSKGSEASIKLVADKDPAAVSEGNATAAAQKARGRQGDIR